MSQLIYQQLEQATPESQGIASSSILGFIEAVEKQVHEMHSFILLRHGRIVAEGWWSPYRKEHLHSLFSLSKSFTSTAIGLAVAEGYFSIDDLLISFFPDDLPPTVSDNLAKMKIRHLLSMATGHAGDTMPFMFERTDGNWSKGFLAAPVEYEPGSHFFYNTGATYMLSALVQKVTGQNLIQYLEPRLFRPLGIENPTWESCPRGINVGGFGLSIRTQDIAAFGQLYLQKGLWGDTRILSESWVDEATSYQVSNGEGSESDWTQGYAYQFWRCRHNAYRGDGAFGQYCVVMPEQDAVLAITSGVADMQIPLNIVWDVLLPAMKQNALPDDEQAHEKLSKKLDSLSLSPVEGKASSAIAPKVSGRTYQFSSNELNIESLVADFNEDGYRFRLKTSTTDEEIACAYGTWHLGESIVFSTSFFKTSMPTVVSGAWLNDTSFKMIVRLYETPFYHSLLFLFTNEQMLLETTINVAFEPPKSLKLSALAV